jgi:hypothetical protein
MPKRYAPLLINLHMNEEKPLKVIIAGLGDIVPPNWSKTNEEFEKLNENLIKTSDSSTKLAKALNYITLASVIIGGGALLLEIYKVFLSNGA